VRSAKTRLSDLIAKTSLCVLQKLFAIIEVVRAHDLSRVPGMRLCTVFCRTFRSFRVPKWPQSVKGERQRLAWRMGVWAGGPGTAGRGRLGEAAAGRGRLGEAAAGRGRLGEAAAGQGIPGKRRGGEDRARGERLERNG
jgi:hypothetical protein